MEKSHSEELHSERNTSKHCEELLCGGMNTNTRTATATATAGQRLFYWGEGRAAQNINRSSNSKNCVNILLFKYLYML